MRFTPVMLFGLLVYLFTCNTASPSCYCFVLSLQPFFSGARCSHYIAVRLRSDRENNNSMRIASDPMEIRYTLPSLNAMNTSCSRHSPTHTHIYNTLMLHIVIYIHGNKSFVFFPLHLRLFALVAKSIYVDI